MKPKRRAKNTKKPQRKIRRTSKRIRTIIVYHSGGRLNEGFGCHKKSQSPLVEIALVLVRLDHVASVIVNSYLPN